MISLAEVDPDKPLLDRITASLVDDKTIYVLNKADLRTFGPERLDKLQALLSIKNKNQVSVISILQKQGLAKLSTMLFQRVEEW